MAFRMETVSRRVSSTLADCQIVRMEARPMKESLEWRYATLSRSVMYPSRLVKSECWALAGVIHGFRRFST